MSIWNKPHSTARATTMGFAALAAGMLLANPSLGAVFTQNFDSDAVGSNPGWHADARFFQSSTNTAAVINTDSVSASNSMEIGGSSNGYTLHAWRDYNGLSSDGVQPITVSFDFKINLKNGGANGLGTVEFDPFIYSNSLLGTNGTPGKDGDGAPVAVIVNNATGVVSYNADGTLIPLIGGGTGQGGYIQGEWGHFSATINGNNNADASITILTGANAGSTGSIANQVFQYNPSGGPDGPNYYLNALDELRGLGFVGPKDNVATLLPTDYLRIDNLSVTIGEVPEPSVAAALSLAFGAGIIRRRRI